MPAATASTGEANPFIKQLASSNRKIRDAALESLRTYLQRTAPFTDLEFLKLWKGLFFCMWMSDKPLTQQRLARDLGGLVHMVKGAHNFLGFVRAFWITVAREWSGIDALRMDKFMYLVRCYVHEGFERVSRGAWADEELLDQYLRILEAVPLNAKDPKIPHGLRFHVVDIYVDELDKVDRQRNVPFETILAPMKKLGKTQLSKAVRERVQEALDDERLEDWENVAEESDEDEAEDAGKHAKKASHDAPEEGEFAGFGD